MIFLKKHVGLLVFDDDPKKTPVSNTRTDALEWWQALNSKSKELALRQHGYHSLESGNASWMIIESIYLSVHAKFR